MAIVETESTASRLIRTDVLNVKPEPAARQTRRSDFPTAETPLQDRVNHVFADLAWYRGQDHIDKGETPTLTLAEIERSGKLAEQIVADGDDLVLYDYIYGVAS